MIKLSKDEYVVLGDNASVSIDSRSFGIIRLPEIRGRVVRVFGRSIPQPLKSAG